MEGCIEIGKKCVNCVHYDACLSVLKASFPSISEEQIEHTRNMDNDCPGFKSVEDFAEVVHGKWIPHYEMLSNKYETVPVATQFECSECGMRARTEYEYCHCGAKMDKK